MSFIKEIENEINDWMRGTGKYCSDRLAYLGDFALFSYQTFAWLCRKLPRREQIVHSFYTIGVLSLPVVILTGMFIGMVLAVQTFAQFKQIGMESMLGGVISLALVRELGPVLAATMLAGRVGSAIAAELGLSVNTIKSHCRRRQRDVASNDACGRGTGDGNQQLCKQCDATLTQTPGARQKRFCSDACRMAWWKANPSAINRRAVYCFTCAVCNMPFESYGNANRKFCSRACSAASRRVSHE